MSEKRFYIDENGNMQLYPQYGQGPAEPADADDLARDALGFTNPNLHRRIDEDVDSRVYPEEYENRSYQLGIYGVNSYRTIKINIHNESAVDIEIP